MPSPRTVPSSHDDSVARLRTASAYLEVAEAVLAERAGDEFLNVAAGLTVLAGIAASDAICGTRLGRRHRGDDHRAAGELLATATVDGRDLANTLSRLLDLKDEAHYGVVLVSAQKARNSLRWARKIVTRAEEELVRR